jgi:hypothetical protein
MDRDRTWLKYFVVFLFLADTLNATFDLVFVYHALVINFGAALFKLFALPILIFHADNVESLATANWSMFILYLTAFRNNRLRLSLVFGTNPAMTVCLQLPFMPTPTSLLYLRV